MGQYLPPAEDADAQSAFRTAEKKYQLHWYQEMRSRYGPELQYITAGLHLRLHLEYPRPCLWSLDRKCLLQSLR